MSGIPDFGSVELGRPEARASADTAHPARSRTMVRAFRARTGRR